MNDRTDKVQSGPSLARRRARDIDPAPIDWLWDKWLAKGEFSLLVGRQGFGKSTLASHIIARLTTGSPLPGVISPGPKVACAILSLEESPVRLKERCLAAGADDENFFVYEDVQHEDRSTREAWKLPHHCRILENAVVEDGVGFVVIEGLGYALLGDGNNYGNVGRALTALVGVAHRTKCAILGTTHPPKGTFDPVTGALGSTAWTSVPRMVWLLGSDERDPSGRRRAVAVSKSNHQIPDKGFSFVIDSHSLYDTGIVRDLRPAAVSPDALAASAISGEERTERDEAASVLRELLSDGPAESLYVNRKMRDLGHAQRTVARARRALGVKSTRQHDPKTGRVLNWFMELPKPTFSPMRQRPGGSLGTLALVRDDADLEGPDRQAVGSPEDEVIGGEVPTLEELERMFEESGIGSDAPVNER